jgi:hypothetical protein
VIVLKENCVQAETGLDTPSTGVVIWISRQPATGSLARLVP